MYNIVISRHFLVFSGIPMWSRWPSSGNTQCTNAGFLANSDFPLTQAFSGCEMVFNWGFGHHEDQIAEMVLIWSWMILHKGPHFSGKYDLAGSEFKIWPKLRSGGGWFGEGNEYYLYCYEMSFFVNPRFLKDFFYENNDLKSSKALK